MKPENFVTFSDAEIKKLEGIWYKRMESTDGIIYGYKMKELVKSYIEDIKRIANQNLKKF